ncbi:MAG TPA: glycoside hydrolase family 30 beta sandwich domain-containing protein [Chitinophagaceae bacterium]|nr:glycoside hydrolase family 30 beta sandwich domain-containing protein [Chitinophagaceae bacterium]
MKSLLSIATLTLVFVILLACNKSHSKSNPDNNPTDTATVNVDFWLTRADQTVLFTKQSTALTFSTVSNTNSTITVDTTTTYQTMDGFGFALTGGSADVIHHMAAANEDTLLHELFSTDGNSIGISYLRISIGASDLDSAVFTFDDMPQGQTDTALANFSIAPDMTDLIPVLKKILTINPTIKILATPWTAPVWMKTNDNSVGGNFNHQYYDVYANYFVKYIEAMRAQGITIDAITPQNEPMNPGNNPSMLLSASEEADFIKNHLGPAFQQAGITAKIIIFDHNCGDPEYPLDILSDTAALKYIDGTAFHLYSGDISALTQIHNAAPQKNVYFTEQWVGAPSNFSGDFNWGIKNLVIGASNNWAKCVLQWNLASDPTYGPHTAGGCTSCMGAVTIGASVVRNTPYYTIAHAAKFVRPGSVRVASSVAAGLSNVAFVTPDGKKVLIVLNESGISQTFNISFKGKIVSPSLPPGGVGTFVW